MQYLLTQEEKDALTAKDVADFQFGQMAEKRDAALHMALVLLRTLDRDQMCIHDPANESSYDLYCDGCPFGSIGVGETERHSPALAKAMTLLPDEVKLFLAKGSNICGLNRAYGK